MATVSTQIGFHRLGDFAGLALTSLTGAEDVEFTYTLENFFHPFLGELLEQLNRNSLPGLFDPKFQEGLAQDFFASYYTAIPSPLVELKPSKKEIDLSDGGPYAVYNWELLFHFPLTIAVHLSKNQRFAEAQRWFHYIFDPTSNDKSLPPQQRFWRFLRFRKETDVQQIGDLVAILSKPGNEDLKARILSGYEAIKNKPFQPHAVARTRTLAYQYCVVMKYLDNLIAWGDSLFMQDTLESINDATQRYVLAANLLGPRPQRIPSRGTIQPKTFAQLKAQGLDKMGDALVELENKFPFNEALPRTRSGPAEAQSGPLFGIGRALYFCIPRNENLLGYWDTVADRLFKIRHCMNIEGVVQQLALFEPPIDPGMLVKAAAAGINVGSIVNGLNQPIGPVRSLFLIQKALELAGEVRGLGGALLSALEKRDGERLGALSLLSAAAWASRRCQRPGRPPPRPARADRGEFRRSPQRPGRAIRKGARGADVCPAEARRGNVASEPVRRHRAGEPSPERQRECRSQQPCAYRPGLPNCRDGRRRHLWCLGPVTALQPEHSLLGNWR
jgi:hypothetical protein